MPILASLFGGSGDLPRAGAGIARDAYGPMGRMSHDRLRKRSLIKTDAKFKSQNAKDKMEKKIKNGVV
jgi:hypothetical protein